MQPLEIMNAKETAKYLGITYSQFWRIMGGGINCPPYTMIGARKRFIRSEVERWLIENQITSRRSPTTTATSHDQ